MGDVHKNTHNDVQLKGRNLIFSILLNIIITVVQAIGGLYSGSLSLLSDALHNFSDVVSLVISYIANRLSQRKASLQKTFGYKRAEILAAFINASILIIVAILLIVEAIDRFNTPKSIEASIVIWLSLIAILGNGISVLLLKEDKESNMNMKSAYLHLLTDMMASIAVFIAGILMKYSGLYYIDSLLTFIIALYLIYMGYDLLKISFSALMLFTPKNIYVKDIVSDIQHIESIKNVHHIHIWQLSEKEIHLEAHIDFEEDINLSQFDVVLQEVELILLNNFGINHVNIQPEYKKHDSKAIIVQD